MVRQEEELNSVYRKLFGNWESVKGFICGICRLDLHHAAVTIAWYSIVD